MEPCAIEVAVKAGDSLFERCRAGEVAAYEELFRLQGARMKSVAFNLLGNRSDAEDAVQEAFLKVHRSIGSFREGARFTTWIYRILTNTCYDIGRQKNRRGEAQTSADSPQSSAVPLRIALQNALACLGERHRTVFLLAEVEGFDHTEIAAIVDTSEGNSRYLLWQAKRELKKILSGGSHE